MCLASHVQDYPSVSQLERSMQRMHASIMFGTFFTARCEVDHLVAALPDTYVTSFFDKADPISDFVMKQAEVRAPLLALHCCLHAVLYEHEREYEYVDELMRLHLRILLPREHIIARLDE